MELEAQIRAFTPFNEQETRDKAVLLSLLGSGANLYGREDPAHLTASAFIVNRARTKALMAYHNIYHAWSWLGGHADGQRDLAAVPLRETREESGVQSARLVTPDIFSLEILTVDGHEKRGVYVSSHLHLNLTYLIEADEDDKLTVKPDENSGVRWFPIREAPAASTEKWMRERIYEKLNQKLFDGLY